MEAIEEAVVRGAKRGERMLGLAGGSLRKVGGAGGEVLLETCTALG